MQAIRDTGSSLLLLIAGIVLAPLVVIGYLALTVLVFLPLLARRSFSRPLGFAPFYSDDVIRRAVVTRGL